MSPASESGQSASSFGSGVSGVENIETTEEQNEMQAPFINGVFGVLYTVSKIVPGLAAAVPANCTPSSWPACTPWPSASGPILRCASGCHAASNRTSLITCGEQG
ncbi:hypothetical protein HaLaN_07267, partial [Haematococcus lacustris]